MSDEGTDFGWYGKSKGEKIYETIIVILGPLALIAFIILAIRSL